MKLTISIFFIIFLWSFSANASTLSGWPDTLETFWLDRAHASGQVVLNQRGVNKRLPGADRVWLVRDPWEKQPVVNKSWVKYWGTRYCTSPEYTRPLGCVGGTALYGYVVILHLPAEVVDLYNASLKPKEQQWRRERCYYSLFRMVQFYFHEALHLIGYSHGSEMTNMQRAMQQHFDNEYGALIRFDDQTICN